MPAYKKLLTKKLCQSCSRQATHQVFNTYNASCGYYCNRCANRRIKELHP